MGSRVFHPQLILTEVQTYQIALAGSSKHVPKLEQNCEMVYNAQMILRGYDNVQERQIFADVEFLCAREDYLYELMTRNN